MTACLRNWSKHGWIFLENFIVRNGFERVNEPLRRRKNSSRTTLDTDEDNVTGVADILTLIYFI